jgi:hypothetical protein
MGIFKTTIENHVKHGFPWQKWGNIFHYGLLNDCDLTYLPLKMGWFSKMGISYDICFCNL